MLECRRLFAAPSALVPFVLIDTSFGTAGHAYATGQNFDAVRKIIVGGDSKTYVAAGSCVTRFTAAGRLDTTFGTRGIVALPGGTFIAEAVDPSGRLNVVVTLGSNTQLRTALLRYTAVGQIDSSFGTGGSTVVTNDAAFTPTGLAMQADGKAVIAGTETTDGGDGRAARLFRMTAAGAADSSFGTGGSVQTNLGANTALTTSIYDVVLGVQVLAGGDIQIGGGTVAYAPDSNTSNEIFSDASVILARFTDAGALDAGFGAGGIARSRYATAAEVKAQFYDDVAATLPSVYSARADGSAVMGDTAAGNAAFDDQYVVTSLNSSGGVTYSVHVPSDPVVEFASLQGVLALPDGRAVLQTDSSLSPSHTAVLTELFADGSVGPTVTTNDLNSATQDAGNADTHLAVASNGQLLAASVGESKLIVQQLNASIAGAPRPDNFPHAGPNSVDVVEYADSNEHYVYVAYYDTAARNLKFVRRLPNGQWDAPITVDPHIGAGLAVSVRADDDGEPVIAYYDSRSKTLKAASSKDYGKTFSLVAVDASAAVGQSVVGVLNLGTASLDFAYYDATNGNLKLATRNRLGRWSTTVVDASKDNVGQQIAISLSFSTYTSNIMIAYSDSTIGEVKYAGQTSKGFQLKNVAATPKGFESLSIYSSNSAVDNTDLPAIAYHDLANDEVRLSVYKKGSTRFVTHTIANRTGQAIALLESNRPDPSVLVYNKYAKRLSLIREPLGDRSVTTVLNGGAYVNGLVFGPLQGPQSALIALVDASTGTLEVRDVLSPS